MVVSAKRAPVAREDMRPCKPLKPKERLRKYAGLFDEQPMPLNFITDSGTISSSKQAEMI
jgi:hypothetical protein